LIHVEQLWAENFFTAQGRLMHEKAHDEGHQRKGEILIRRGMRIKSARLGLIGMADIVEFHRDRDGHCKPFPVEYKRGRSKPDDCDRVQLCAQALCLEEIQETEVPAGAIFYGKTKRRELVAFDRKLRDKTAHACEELHILIDSGKTPPAHFSEKCDRCSLKELCLPKVSEKHTVENYFRKMKGDYEETP
jgi:CRISPR-associated exonuclease Cas4